MRLPTLVMAAISLWAGIYSAQAQTSGIVKSEVAARRVALIVGVSRYKFIPSLDNPKNDATLMANTLRSLGFTLVGGGPQLDLDKPGFDRLVQQFGREVAGADVALFYYAGHGLQVRGSNWLVPTTANPTREADVPFEMVDANVVLQQMEGSGTRLNLMILDACRNNPFGGRGLRDTGGGLAQMKAPEGTLISYATQPGNVAADGKDGNSPFTRALAQTMKRPGLDVFKLFNEVGLEVKRATSGDQQPWVSNSPIDGDFYFLAVPPGSTVTVQTPPAPADAELLFWQTIASSSNPADYRAYLETYPSGRFAALARARSSDVSVNSRLTSGSSAAYFQPGNGWPESRPSEETQASMAVPTPANLTGKWRGTGGRWQLELTIEAGQVTGSASCESIVYRIRDRLDHNNRLDASAQKVTPGSSNYPTSVAVLGMMPQLVVRPVSASSACALSALVYVSRER